MNILRRFFSLAAVALLSAQAATASVFVPTSPTIGDYGLSVPLSASAPILASVNADGWSGIPVSPASSYAPDVSPVTFPITRQCYDTSGNATTCTETITLTQRVRQAYPSYASLDTTGRTSLSNWICNSDSGNFTNNSAIVCPAPVAMFRSTDHQLVTSSITVEFVAYHIMAKSQQPIPYATCNATDGTTTTSPVAATYYTNLAGPYDTSPLAGFKASINITTLANAVPVTVNCRAYPWAAKTDGTAILDSSTSPFRGWVPQVYYRNTAAPTTYYIANTTATPAGSDTTGSGTNALPYATHQKALNVMGATGRDGSIIYIKEDSSGAGAVYTATNAGVTVAGGAKAEVLIQADPAATGVVTFNTGTSYVDFNTNYVRLKNLKVVRGSGNPLYSNNNAGPVGRIAFENDTIDVSLGGGFKMGNNGRFVIIGGSTIGYATSGGGSYNPTSTFSVPLIISHTITGTVGGSLAVDQYGWMGNNLTGILGPSLPSAWPQDGMIVVNTKMLGLGGAAIKISDATLATIGNIAIVNNLLEMTTTTNVGSVFISNDPPIKSAITNLIVWNNTSAGAFTQGRWNFLYDNNNSGACVGTTGATNWCGVRTHTLISFVANFISQVNEKNDMFVGSTASDTVNAPAHTGSWGVNYGTGFRDNAFPYANGFGGTSNVPPPTTTTNNDSPAYMGLNGHFSSAQATRTDLWTAYRGATYNGSAFTAGTGVGRDYTPCSVIAGECTGVSPAYQRTKGPSLVPYTLGGVAVPATNANAGAY